MTPLPTELVELVDRSAEPDRARALLRRVRAASGGDVIDGLVADGALGARFVAVAAASSHLGGLLVSDPAALTVLAHVHERPEPPDDVGDLRAWSQRELLRIAALDLTGRADLDVVTGALSALARDVLGVCVRSLDLGDDRLAVIGMGKVGGDELNYASDVDVVLVGEGDPGRLERAGRTLLERAGQCFRVDADLRPEGRDGPLVRSLAGYAAYWERWADPWERQALLRAVPAAGDDELGAAWSRQAQATVWGRPLDADDLRYVRAMKVRAEEEVRRRGVAEREVKRGPGGIRDVEFACQLLQLVHGPVDPEVRSPHTRRALAALAAGGYVDPADAEVLDDSYVFLRRVEHALQLDAGRQTHTVPDDRGERRHLARVLGYRGSRDGGPTELFDRDHAAHRGRVRSVHERVWFRPLLAALSGSGPLGPEAAADRLAAFGFTEVERTRQAVAELTRGLTRSSRMMQQLLPLLLDWLSASPDPDLGLLGLRRLATGEKGTGRLASAFRDAPDSARQLALLLGTSRHLGEILEANPDLVERLPDPDQLRTRPRAELVEAALAGIAWRTDPVDRQRALRRWKRRNLLGIAARDVFGQANVEMVGRDLAALAEASLEAVLGVVAPGMPFAVVALGRLGGCELGYASDLDLAFVYDGADVTADEAERVAAHLMRTIGGETPTDQIWAVDAGLRPEGRNGPLARSLDGWERYLGEWASTWERQAYLRARPVAGDPALGRRLVDQVQQAIWARPFGEEDQREVRRMKARIERERIGRGEDPKFHLKLGPGSLSDIEFTVQLLQLRHAVPGTATIAALEDLVEAGHLSSDEAEVLEVAYRFCERARNRSFLVVGPGDSLPLRPEQAMPLARSLSTTVPGLREQYLRVTRRARRVVEARFYGRESATGHAGTLPRSR